MRSIPAVPGCQHGAVTRLRVQWVDQKEVWDKERVMQGIIKEPEPQHEPPTASPAPEQPGQDPAAGISKDARQDAGDAGPQHSDADMQVVPHSLWTDASGS